MSEESKVEVKEVDIKKMIVDGLKEEGIEIAEEAAIATAKAIFKIIPVVVAATPNKIDDLLIPVLAVVKDPVIKVLDNINKADNVA